MNEERINFDLILESKTNHCVEIILILCCYFTRALFLTKVNVIMSFVTNMLKSSRHELFIKESYESHFFENRLLFLLGFVDSYTCVKTVTFSSPSVLL